MLQYIYFFEKDRRGTHSLKKNFFDSYNVLELEGQLSGYLMTQ